MTKKTLVLAFIVVGIFGSAAFTLAPMGPPKAALKQSQYRIGIEYALSEMDLENDDATATYELGGIPDSGKGRLELSNIKSNWILANAGYGLNDEWEVFLRAGMVDAKDEMEMSDIGMLGSQFSGDFGIAFGAGTKVNLLHEGNLTWGGLVQVTWAKPDKSDFKYTNVNGGSDANGTTWVDVPISGDVELEWLDIQIAFGPTWEKNGFCIYGGPFFHLIDGDYDAKGSGNYTIPGSGDFTATVKISSDIEQGSEFGGYIGAQWDLGEKARNALWNAELHFTGDAWAFGTGIFWKLP